MALLSNSIQPMHPIHVVHSVWCLSYRIDPPFHPIQRVQVHHIHPSTKSNLSTPLTLSTHKKVVQKEKKLVNL